MSNIFSYAKLQFGNKRGVSMNCFKYIVVVVMLGGLFGTQYHPTQEQIDDILSQAMHRVWLEAMRANTAVNAIMPQVREELLENLCSSAPAVNFVAHADLSDSVTSAGNTSASIFVSMDNQNSWIENSDVNPIDFPGYDNTWGATTTTSGGNSVNWYLWGSVDSGSLGLDFGQITVSQSPYNGSNMWPPSDNLYALLLEDSNADTGSGQDIVNLKVTYSDNKLYTSMGLEGSCCNEGSFFGPWNLYAIAIVNPDALENGVAYAYAYGDGGLGQLYPGIYKISGDFSSGVGEVGGFEILSENFDYTTAGNQLQASSLLSTITNDSDWGEWPNSYNGIAVVGVTVEAGLDGLDVAITVLDSTNPGLFIMSTQSQYSNTAPVLLNPDYTNGTLSVTYLDNENNLAKNHEVFIEGDMVFTMVPSSHTYSEGVIFSLTDINTSGVVTFSFSDGAEAVSLDFDLGGGGESCSMPGDVNGDGGVNVLDIVLTTNLILCQDCPDNYNMCADLNSDDSLNVLDVVLMVNLILGTM